jgi:hypothetical protein
VRRLLRGAPDGRRALQAGSTWGEPGKGVGTRSRTAPSNWSKVRKWNKKAAEAPGKTFVFCASLADVFDNAVPIPSGVSICST